MQTAAVQIVPMAEVTILKKNLSAFPHILQIPLSFLIPGIGIRASSSRPIALLDDQCIAIFLIVFPFRIDTIRVL